MVIVIAIRYHGAMDSHPHNPTPEAQPAGCTVWDTALFSRILYASEDRQHALEMLQTFLTNGGDPETIIDDNLHRWNLLSYCATATWPAAVQTLLAAGADVHANQDEALRRASEHGRLPIVECLLAAGADVHAHGDMALYYAVVGDHWPIVERLLAAGADVHTHDDMALQWAARFDRRDAVERLLAAGADVHANKSGALRWAVDNGHLSVVERLLAAGADVHVYGDMALRTVLKRGDVAGAASLLRHGADAAAAWAHLARQDRNRKCAAVLDALAAAIPRAQCRDLLRTSPRRFPRIQSMLAAEGRKTIDRPSLSRQKR